MNVKFDEIIIIPQTSNGSVLKTNCLWSLKYFLPEENGAILLPLGFFLENCELSINRSLLTYYKHQRVCRKNSNIKKSFFFLR